jgi:hypothetical protein
VLGLDKWVCLSWTLFSRMRGVRVRVRVTFKCADVAVYILVAGHIYGQGKEGTSLEW